MAVAPRNTHNKRSLIRTSHICHRCRAAGRNQQVEEYKHTQTDYIKFKKYYKMVAVDLSKQQALDADPKGIQQINFTANLERHGNTRFYFILEKAKEFSQGTVNVL